METGLAGLLNGEFSVDGMSDQITGATPETGYGGAVFSTAADRTISSVKTKA